MKASFGNVWSYPLVLSLAFCLTAGCAGRGATPMAANAAEPQEQADVQADGGLPAPPPPTKKGIIVPSDVGAASHPGTTPTAGTNENGLGSPIGPARSTN
jgi:hypothetical protein